MSDGAVPLRRSALPSDKRAQREQAFGLLGGALAWFFHHAVGYFVIEVHCHSERLVGAVLGLDASLFLELVLTVLAAGVAVAAGLTALKHWPGGSVLGGTEEPGAPEHASRTRFNSAVGVGLNALFLLAILTGASAFLFLRPC